MTQEPLTIESLARSIHADELAAAKAAGLPIASTHHGRAAVEQPFDELDERWKACRREQARLMLNRWMR